MLWYGNLVYELDHVCLQHTKIQGMVFSLASINEIFSSQTWIAANWLMWQQASQTRNKSFIVSFNTLVYVVWSCYLLYSDGTMWKVWVSHFLIVICRGAVLCDSRSFELIAFRCFYACFICILPIFKLENVWTSRHIMWYPKDAESSQLLTLDPNPTRLLTGGFSLSGSAVILAPAQYVMCGKNTSLRRHEEQHEIH